MPISKNELHKIAQLSFLSTENTEQLEQDVQCIMDFVEQLRNVDTTGIDPLSHPLNLHQRLREDTVTEADCLDQLEAIAPLFSEGLYLVPKVIDSGK